MKDICIEDNAKIEMLPQIGEILGVAGVNIEGLCFTKLQNKMVLHFAVEDDHKARCVIEDAGVKIKKISEVYVICKDKIRITGKPGSFGQIFKALIDQGIKINFGYPAENNRFVIGSDEINKIQNILEP
ncbi:MAG: hypothetical protein HQK83_08870 [Fibrobacteria bacterium]|nr:hypothetical protein [Fibrobacteria bacterium]